ncbi:MAG: 30S ribosomal protein S17 [Planctomycetes bacterium]|nr:30S ribosomal protein S17 [Planctomycetota bacterium]
MSAPRGNRKLVTGRVVSTRMAKTVKVEQERVIQHPQFRKYLRRSTTLMAHDEKGEAKVGDIVELVACRRLSKTKTWRLLRVVRAAVQAEVTS